MRTIALLTACVLIAVSGFAADPNTARGFEAGKMYDFLGLDSVSVFNGNLNLAIPIGQKYSVRPGFDYQLTLSYNAKVWDYAGMGDERITIPEKHSNSGFGWSLSLGRMILEEYEPLEYISPDGAQHQFVIRQQSETPVVHSDDESYLRYNITYRILETADGLRHSFDTSGRLTEIIDRFGNWVRVSYAANNDWTITDGYGETTVRTHTITFEDAPSGLYGGGYPNFQRRVKTVTLSTFGGSSSYEFHYSDPIVTGSTCGIGEPMAPGQYRVPLLTSVDLPQSAGSFVFDYYLDDTAHQCATGAVKSMKVPTLGSVEWEYDIYELPHEDCTLSSNSGTHVWYDDHAGVVKRTLKNAGGTTLESVTYDPHLVPGAWQTIACGGPPSIYMPGPPILMTNTVTRSTGQKTVHHFSAYNAIGRPLPDPTLAYINEYGLPFTRTQASAGASDHFLSTTIAEGSGSPLRSTYVKYDQKRLLSSRTELNGDTGCGLQSNELCFTQKTSSDFDSVGHYRYLTTTGNLIPGQTTASQTHVSFTDYNPGVSGTSLWPITSHWILNTYTTASETEGGVTRSTVTSFLDGKGVIGSVQTGTGSDALLNVTCRDTRGFVTRERLVFLGTTTREHCSESRAALDAGEYELNYTYEFLSNGVSLTGRKARYFGTNFDVVDESFNTNTGLVSSTRDSAQLQTTYTYDGLSRLTNVAAPGSVSTGYTYTAATTTTPARVSEVVAGVGKSITRHYDYDSVGRLSREFRSMPDSKWALRETEFDEGGRVKSASEWISVTSPNDTATHPSDSQKTRTLYDVFDRPTSTTRPDNSVTSFVYQSGRSATRKTNVRTTAGTELSEVVESYDSLGRIASVDEQSGARSQNNALGAMSKTTYQYTPTGKLYTVAMGTQSPRTFVYDHRDLLTQETHPEQTVTYDVFDAKGQFRSRNDGRGALTYEYDAATRLTSVKSGGTEIKKFTFGTTGAAIGKLWKTSRLNQRDVAGAIVVAEEYAYSSTHGKPTSRTTTITKGEQTIQTFSQSFDYDALLALSTVGYPTCTGCTVPAGGVGSLSLVRDQGYLTSVKEGTTTYGSMSYAANGMATAVKHGADTSTVIDNYTPDGALPRPSNIQFSGIVACSSPAQPVITTNAEACPSGSGSASVTAQTNVTFAWTIAGGTINGANTGTSISFTAGPSGTVTLTVVASNDCATSEATRQVPIGPTATVSRGTALNDMVVTLTGNAPWSIVWQDGWQQNDIASSPVHRYVTQSGTYSVTTVGDFICPNGTSTGQVVFVAAPAAVAATTQSNTSILVSWPAVTTATSYEVERSTRLTDPFVVVQTTTGTSWIDTPPRWATPTAYIYRVRALKGTERSDPSPSDYATTSLTIFNQSVVSGQTLIYASLITELRAAIDALRYAAGLAPAFNGMAAPSGPVTASTFTGLIGPLDAARAPWGFAGFAYSAATQHPNTNVLVRAGHILEVREALK